MLQCFHKPDQLFLHFLPFTFTTLATVKIKNNWRIFSGIFGSAALNYNSIYPSKNGFRMRAICYTLSRGTAAAILPLSMYWSWTMSIVDYPASVLSCTTIIRIKINQICLYTRIKNYWNISEIYLLLYCICCLVNIVIQE